MIKNNNKIKFNNNNKLRIDMRLEKEKLCKGGKGIKVLRI